MQEEIWTVAKLEELITRMRAYAVSTRRSDEYSEFTLLDHGRARKIRRIEVDWEHKFILFDSDDPDKYRD